MYNCIYIANLLYSGVWLGWLGQAWQALAYDEEEAEALSSFALLAVGRGAGHEQTIVGQVR